MVWQQGGGDPTANPVVTFRTSPASAHRLQGIVEQAPAPGQDDGSHPNGENRPWPTRGACWATSLGIEVHSLGRAHD